MDYAGAALLTLATLCLLLGLNELGQPTGWIALAAALLLDRLTYVLLPGDPARVPMIAKLWDRRETIRRKESDREARQAIKQRSH